MDRQKLSKRLPRVTNIDIRYWIVTQPQYLFNAGSLLGPLHRRYLIGLLRYTQTSVDLDICALFSPAGGRSSAKLLSLCVGVSSRFTGRIASYCILSWSLG